MTKTALVQVLDDNVRLRGEIKRLKSINKKLVEALEELSNRHAGYEHGLGECFCNAHIKAKQALALAKDDS